jgi:hypothetical protein
MHSIAVRFARRAAVRQSALELLARHGLLDWTFAFNRRKRALGKTATSIRSSGSR